MNRMKARLETPDQLGARPRFAGAHYALMQALYWGLMAAYFAFGTAYLYELGLSSLQTGLALMAAGVISAALQPLLAARADRSGRPKTVRVISMALLLPAAVLLALLWLLPLRRIFLVSLYALAWMLLWTQQFLINSLAMSYENAGWRLNYGAGRALGSLAYAAAAYAYGFLCAAQGTAVLLPVSALICTLLFVCVALWRTPEAALHASSAARQPENGGGRFAARYPRFMLLTAGAALCLTPYCTTCNYLIRVVESVGGSSVELGTAVMIAALCEVPVMLLLVPLTKRFGSYALILTAAVMLTAKMLMICLARSITALYITQLLQLFSYPLFLGVSVLYVNERMAPGDRVRGQSFMTLVQTVGSAVGALLGGFLLDRFGVSGMLTVCLILSAAGSTVMMLGAERGSGRAGGMR